MKYLLINKVTEQSTICEKIEIGGGEFYISEDKRHSSNTYKVILKTRKSLELFHSMYDEATIYLDRKFEKFNEILDKRSKSKWCFYYDNEMIYDK